MKAEDWLEHRQGTPARFASRTSLVNVPATCVQDAHNRYISRCSGLRNVADYHRANGWICTTFGTPPQPRAPSPLPSPAHNSTMSDKALNIFQLNGNGIGNKQGELSIFLEAHNVKVVAIQESKFTAQSRSPNIQNYTLVRQDRRIGPGGGLTAQSVARWTLTSNCCGFYPHCKKKVESENLKVTIRAIK